ncbi:UvrD-helicase domain-containing protein [Candidatus Amarolinea dominans]|uniref:UvrD-helicase domain-containing protein n=1 Tax=Candidatus Amarolinea dominans TaxID=3140696 RepID=UPI0031CCCB35
MPRRPGSGPAAHAARRRCNLRRRPGQPPQPRRSEQRPTHRQVAIASPGVWVQPRTAGTAQPAQRVGGNGARGPAHHRGRAGHRQDRTLTVRIGHSIEVQGAAPEAILAITFTNKAAAERTSRLDLRRRKNRLRPPASPELSAVCEDERLPGIFQRYRSRRSQASISMT